MVFRTTSTKANSGAVLVDLLVGISVSSLILLVLVSSTFYSGRSFAAMSNYTELENTSRIALDLITRDIRSCSAVTSQSETAVSILDRQSKPISFTYDKQARTLTRVKDGVSKVLLTSCDELKWEIFQRTPIAGTGGVYPAKTIETTKLLQVNWVCSRNILGQKRNTETVRSAKITIRKRG